LYLHLRWDGRIAPPSPYESKENMWTERAQSLLHRLTNQRRIYRERGPNRSSIALRIKGKYVDREGPIAPPSPYESKENISRERAQSLLHRLTNQRKICGQRGPNRSSVQRATCGMQIQVPVPVRAYLYLYLYVHLYVPVQVLVPGKAARLLTSKAARLLTSTCPTNLPSRRSSAARRRARKTYCCSHDRGGPLAAASAASWERPSSAS